MKYVLLFAVCAALAIFGCRKQKKDVQSDNSTSTTQQEPNRPPAVTADANDTIADWYTGKVEWQDLEGGFWLLTADDGQRFAPINLPEDFRKDGLKVIFQVREKKDAASIHMRGKIVEIIYIEKIIDKRT